MKKIFKYKVLANAYTLMPKGAEIIHVGQQGSDVYVWAIVDLGEGNFVQDMAERKIIAYGTGHPMLEDSGEFIGTAQLDNGLVFHFFDRGEA